MRKTYVIIASLVVLILVPGLLRLNDLSLYTDSTRYLLWAESLGAFNGWTDNTQPVPEAYVVNAPLYPLLVAPGSWFAASPMTGVKVATLLYGACALLLFFFWTRRLIGDRAGLLLAVLLAVMPMTVVLFTEILSESVYLLMVFSALFILQEQTPPEGRKRTALILLLAFLPLVREIGLALVAAVVIVTFLRGDRRLALTAAGMTVFVFLAWSLRNLLLVGTPETSQAANMQFILQRALTTPDESIVTEFARRVSANIGSYRFELSGMVLFPIPFPLIAAPSSVFLSVFHVLQAVKPYAFLMFLPLLGYGMWTDWRAEGGRIRILFVVLSLCIILVYPVQDVRFLYPLLPFFLFFGAQALRQIEGSSRRWYLGTGIAVAAVVAVPNILTTYEVVATNQRYLAWSSGTDSLSGPPPGPYFASPWERVGSWIRLHTPDDAVIASSAKEVAPFIGGRKLLEVNKAVPRPQFEEMLRDHDVTILVSPLTQDGFYAYGLQLMGSDRVRVRGSSLIGSIAILDIPSLLSGPMEAPARSVPETLLVAETGLLRARTLILHGHFRLADSLLRDLMNKDPGNAEAAFQRLAALSLLGDREAAVQVQQELFRSPRSTSYIPVSRRLLDMAGHLEQTGLLTDPGLIAGAYYQAARVAWDMGYTAAARQYLAMSLQAQPDAYEPGIWSAFYAIQDGDLAGAERTLTALQRMYEDDRIVADLSAVLALHRTLRQDTDPTRRARRWLDIAVILERLELYSPAVDAAIASRQLDPSIAEATEKLRSLLGRTGKDFALTRL